LDVPLIVLLAPQQMFVRFLKRDIVGIRLQRRPKSVGKFQFTFLWLSLNKNPVLELMQDLEEQNY
jgi:hypothetical protein